MAARTAMEHPIDALPRTPFPASRDFAPVGSMSLDSRVAGLPYESSSFATSRGNERYEGKNSELYTSRTFSAFSLFGGCRHHLARWEACHMTQKVNPVTLTSYSSPVRAIPQPSAPQALSPPERSEHNPSTQPVAKAAPLFLNLRRQPPPQPSGPKAPSNLRTLRPIGPVNPKNLPF